MIVLSTNMKFTTELIVVIASSCIYFSGARTEDDAESSTTVPSVKTTEESHHGPSSNVSSLAPLPMATDTFDSIRKKGKLFVDKSSFIWKFMDEGGLYVLTRPKRFGKSVFLQMIRRFLEGRKELFSGTKIANRGNGPTEDGTWTPYPVIYLDFELIAGAHQFEEDLRLALKRIAKCYKLKMRPNRHADVSNLIFDLYEKTGKRVSILIDNYDYPLINNEHRPEHRRKISDILRIFYGYIRGNVRFIRLALVVGVSKLNIVANAHARFTDLTFKEEFESVMGFDLEDVEKHLKPYFQDFAQKSKIKKRENETIPGLEEAQKWYGGHRFAISNNVVNKVLNPASTCACLEEKQFADYMVNTYPVTIIKDKMSKSKTTMKTFEHFKMRVSELKMFNLEEDEISLPFFMLCYGFLTIKGYCEKNECVILGYANDEIRRNLIRQLPETLVQEYGLKDALMYKDVGKFVHLLNEYTFKDLSHSLNLPLTEEFMATRQILPILKATGIQYKEGEILWTASGENQGDLDIHILLDASEFVIGMKYKKSGAESIFALIMYILKDEDAFRCRIRQDKDIFLLGLNVKPLDFKGKIVTSASIDQWVLLPYKDGKIWVNETETSPNIAHTFVKYFKDRLHNNWEEFENSTKIIW